ncbi:MAG: hypothetical protein LBG64_00530, partial [Pseudomonadales bacterium]|nr:hypothetical protein [Pseudomonadales bacterium]
MLTLNQLRQKYLDYYQSLNHIVIPSASLVPENDPTTLFTSSGMQPLVTYLLGQKHPKGIRLTDSQKCFRAVDIEEVGDARHITFFEMLGNWSLGDYFKEEQLPYIWNFLVENMGLDPKRLYTTVFEGDEKIGISPDEESIAIMQKLYGEVGLEAQVEKNAEVNGMLPEHRIFMYDAKKNWWSRSGVPENMPAGEPGGPTSEIFYDFGADLGIHENSAWKNEKCHPNCDCGRFIEICNSVLMEYKKQTDGSFAKLSQRNIDFGMSVERLMMSYEGKDDVFLTSAFYPYAEFVCGLIDVEYEGLSEEMRKQVRIIVDHVRSSVMLIADGVVPSSKEQGYILRRLIRRSIRSARKLGYEGPFLVDLAQLVINFYQGYYTDLTEKADFIKDTLRAEESKFRKKKEKGLKELAK